MARRGTDDAAVHGLTSGEAIALPLEPALGTGYRDSLGKPVSVSRPDAHWWRRLLGFMGPGYLIAVGYMDPGNWATDLAAGSGFGYALLWVIMLSNLMAILLQVLAVRLGIATGMDLAQACRANSGKLSGFMQWIACEIAIVACDLAEVIGTAIALNLLFGIPMVWGVALTALDAAIVFWLQGRGMRYLEAAIIGVLILVLTCFSIMLVLAQPEWAAVARGLIPRATIFSNTDMLYIGIGIVGATVMPHNLYLHSAIVQHRQYPRTEAGKRDAIRMASTDVIIALLFAFMINAAILILSASVFHVNGMPQVAEIQDAHRLLAPMLGTGMASFLFALALLASGQSSTVTATLAGQIVMEGFLDLRLKPWMRRLLTRSIAIVPAMIVAGYYGESGVARLLVFSQVVLSMQLPFAVVPLVRYTADKRQMGVFASKPWLTALATLVALLIIGLNLRILYQLWMGV